MIPGEYRLQAAPILCNADRKAETLFVVNRGDRPIQVGSHFHFYEINNALEFERKLAYGMRLNIPAGTAVRFEPGDEKEVKLVPFSGMRHVYGLNQKVNGPLDKEEGE
ncbi:urease subunit beta [Ectobacillus panaciterrae]|uniref:urease subunit beta n=1 Tax=Ectobacillus panaciterrae TaxID=363872 RepID=UPI0004022E35|nr:urease subunit beta [Ectobacillus panaciterrae]